MCINEYCSISILELVNPNRLTINLKKSKTLLFSNLRRQKHLQLKSKLSINIHGTALETVNHYKYLRVMLDEKLSFAFVES